MANIIKTTLEDANDVLTYNNRASFPSSGESGKLYIAADTKYTYFWNGSSYVETRGSGYSSSGHTHDDRYYTESEVDNKLKYLKPTIITNGAIDTHPESTDGGTLISYYTNDLVNLSERGGSCYIKNLTQNTIVSASTRNQLFDGSPSYYVLSAAQNDIIEIIIKSPTVYNWTTRGGIGFGNIQWGAKSIKIEVGYSETNTGSASSPDNNIVWITKFNETNNWDQLIYTNLTGPNSNEGGTNSNSWSYLRITLTNFRHSSIHRIAQIFTFNYASTGMHETFLPKAGGYMLGNIAPYKNNSYWLGGDNNKWAGIHAVNIYQNGNKVIDTSSISSQTVNKSKYLISPSDVPTNANISDKENTNKAKLRVDLATSSMTTNKPVRDGFIYTNIWDINNSKNNNSQLYIPNGYHITDGKRLSVRGCKDDTWQTSWKELAYYSDIPTSLKNPKSLKFGSKSYDGSSEVQLTASDLGISIPEITATTSGNGNAVTGISAIGHALTITKGSTFLTSHLYRPIQVNGTQILANNSSTALNLKTGSNISITNSSGTVTISATNTTYSAGTGLSLNETTFSVKTGYTTDATNRNYKVAADSNGNLYVNVPWSSSGTLDTSLNSSSTNALQNKAIYSAFSSAVGYDNNYYAYGEKGSWRIRQYNATGNSLDIRYGIIAINSQSTNYSVSFSKNFTSTQYTVVFGLYRSNTQSWFWSPIVQNKTVSGFTVFLRGNSSGDNGGTIMYLAIRSN